jgi:UDP-glucuronate 4-epimerase
MALFKFVKAMLNGDQIDVYNRGEMRRDFTYVDDLVEAVWRLADIRPERPASQGEIAPYDSLSAVAPFRIVNIGKSKPDTLDAFITEIEKTLGIEANRNLMDMQPGDVPATWSDTRLLTELTKFEAPTGIAQGIPAFVSWYRKYYDV